MCSEFKKGILVLQVPCLSHSCFLCDEKKKERKKLRTIIFFLSIRIWSVIVQGNPSLGLWIPHRGFQIPGTGFRPLTVELQFRIPNPRIPDFTSKHFLDSRIQIPFYGVSVANKLTKNLFISLSLIIHLFIKFLQKSRTSIWYANYKDCIYSIKRCVDY